MTVSVTGTQKLNPFPSRGDFDPIGQMIGVSSATGDATGGQLRITFDLDETFAYIMRGMSLLLAGGTGDIPMELTYLPGNNVDGVAVRYTGAETQTTILGQTGMTFIPPRVLVLPDGTNSAQIQGRVPNVNLDILTVSYHALVFDRIALVKNPPAFFVGFLA